MNISEFLKDFMDNHTPRLSRGEVWEQSELMNLMLSYHNYALKNMESSSRVIESPEIQKANLYGIMSIYLRASEEVSNGIYDPIEEAIKEIQTKYTIIQKDSL